MFDNASTVLGIGDNYDSINTISGDCYNCTGAIKNYGVNKNIMEMGINPDGSSYCHLYNLFGNIICVYKNCIG